MHHQRYASNLWVLAAVRGHQLQERHGQLEPLGGFKCFFLEQKYFFMVTGISADLGVPAVVGDLLLLAHLLLLVVLLLLAAIGVLAVAGVFCCCFPCC